MAKNFAIIGCAGYIAPRHLEAIKKTGNTLVAALDKSDSVGILDKYSHKVKFFTEFERFDRHAEKLRRSGEQNKIHFVSICSPNYLHDAHIRFAFRIGADAICEKPLVLNPWNIDALEELENETGKKVFNILQLRLHPAVIDLKQKVQSEPKKKYDINLEYITPRGEWYFTSWKGDLQKSGGLATNIGIHLFDMLLWIFGKVIDVSVESSKKDKIMGTLKLERANIRWFLSVDQADLPKQVKEQGKSSFRSLKLNGEEYEFSDGFTELHTKSYEEILEGRGFRISDVRPSIELAYKVRELSLKAETHNE